MKEKIIKNNNTYYYLGQSHDFEYLYLKELDNVYQLAMCEDNIKKTNKPIFHFAPLEGYNIYTYDILVDQFDEPILNDKNMHKLCDLLEIVFIANNSLKLHTEFKKFFDTNQQDYYKQIIKNTKEEIDALLS